MNWFLLIAPAVWLTLTVFPPTFTGPRATHNAARIIRPVGPINSDGSTTVHVHVQEKGEYRLHKLLGLIASVPYVLFPFDPLQIALTLEVVTMLGVDQFTRRLNAIDYAGHGAEIIAAERAGDTGYREAEIARMSDDHDKRGQDIPAELRRLDWLARIVYTLGR
jgi:hypothetical protein